MSAEVGPGAKGRVRALLDLARYDAALQAARDALTADVHSAELWRLTAFACVRLGRFSEGLAASEHALTLDPESSWAHRLRGLTLCELGRTDEGFAELEHALALSPLDVGALQDAAMYGAAHGRFELAEEAAARAVAAHPDHIAAWSAEATVADRQHDWRRVERAARRMRELEPRSSLAHNWLGWSVKQQYRLEEAASSFREALHCDPSSRLPFTNLANTLYELGRLEELVALHQDALELDVSDPKLWTGLAHAYEGLGRLDEAIDAVLRALELDPNAEWPMRLHSVLLWETGQRARSLMGIRRCSAAHPRYPYTRRQHACAAAGLGRFAEAHAALDAIRPHEDTLRAWTESVRAYVYFFAGDPHATARASERALQLDPTDHRAIASGGYAALAGGQFEEAGRLLDCAATRHPDCCTMTAAAWAYGAAARRDEALARLTTARGRVAGCGCPLRRRAERLLAVDPVLRHPAATRLLS